MMFSLMTQALRYVEEWRPKPACNPPLSLYT